MFNSATSWTAACWASLSHPDRNFLKSFLWKWYSEEINRNMTWCTMSGCLKRPFFRIWDREFEKWFSFPFAKHRIMESQYWRETWGRLLIRKKLTTTLISSNREIIHYALHTPWTYIASKVCSYEKSYSKMGTCLHYNFIPLKISMQITYTLSKSEYLNYTSMKKGKRNTWWIWIRWWDCGDIFFFPYFPNFLWYFKCQNIFRKKKWKIS